MDHGIKRIHQIGVFPIRTHAGKQVFFRYSASFLQGSGIHQQPGKLSLQIGKIFPAFPVIIQGMAHILIRKKPHAPGIKTDGKGAGTIRAGRRKRRKGLVIDAAKNIPHGAFRKIHRKDHIHAGIRRDQSMLSFPRIHRRCKCFRSPEAADIGAQRRAGRQFPVFRAGKKGLGRQGIKQIRKAVFHAPSPCHSSSCTVSASSKSGFISGICWQQKRKASSPLSS